MSDYTQTTDFSSKDALSQGDPDKIIYGADIDTELAAIDTAISSKANKVGSPTTNNLTKLTGTGDLADSGYRFASLSGEYTIYDNGDNTIGIPSGTKMLFQQTSAPTGWTKDSTHNNKALRVVTGTASSGGTNSFSDSLGSGAAVSTDSHTLTVSEIPAHTHTAYQSPDNWNSTGGGNLHMSNSGNNQSATATGSTGGGSGHSHTLSIDIEYVDLIIATKD